MESLARYERGPHGLEVNQVELPDRGRIGGSVVTAIGLAAAGDDDEIRDVGRGIAGDIDPYNDRQIADADVERVTATARSGGLRAGPAGAAMPIAVRPVGNDSVTVTVPLVGAAPIFETAIT